MQTVRLYDPQRSPPSWRDTVRPGQFAVFSTDIDSGTSCDADGVPFASADAATCVLVDSLGEAEAFCRAQVDRHAGLRFDVFDSAGRTAPPLLTVVHPSRASGLEGNRRSRRVSNLFALLLLGLAPVLFWFDWARHDGVLVVPTVVAINCVVIAGRLLALNLSYVSAEKSRRTRVAELSARRTLDH